jgi:hypothetical protein
MARPAEKLAGYDTVLRDYLRALSRVHHQEAAGTPGRTERTCATCGRRSGFLLDPEGIWYRCTHCGTYA